MFKGDYITIPNILSLSRLVLLPILFLLIVWDLKEAFLVSYILLGSTDFFDGFIARKFNQKTEIGKTLDSFADIFFYVSTAYFIYALFPQYIEPNNKLLIVFFALFFLSFLISGVLCKKPIMMHTYLLKLNGILVYLLVVLSYFFNTTLFITIILLIYLVGFIEEIAIFIKYGEVDPDTPSFLSLNKNKS